MPTTRFCYSKLYGVKTVHPNLVFEVYHVPWYIKLLAWVLRTADRLGWR